MKTSNLTVYTIAHGLVDAACAAAIFAGISKGSIKPENVFFIVLLYNVLAFGLQAPIGYLIDILRLPVHTAVLGCLLTGAAVLLWQFPVASILLAGIGNALFHVGGGVVSLNLDYGKASLPGIYVAFGAMGLFIGGLAGRSAGFMPWPFAVLLGLVVIAMLAVKSPYIDYDTEPGRGNLHPYFELIILLLMLSIVVRSVVGLAMVFPWRSNMALAVLLTIGIVLGKALGGILADRFGWMKVSVLSLLISAPLLAFGSEYPYLAIPALFLFNMTMPITLTAAANLLPGRTGFAFGLTTLALIIGALPSFTPLKAWLNQPIILLIIIVLSAVSLLIGLRFYQSKDHSKTATGDGAVSPTRGL
jgi:FSR family fosmidomycin resistance protein-like MFS transporter